MFSSQCQTLYHLPDLLQGLTWEPEPHLVMTDSLSYVCLPERAFISPSLFVSINVKVTSHKINHFKVFSPVAFATLTMLRLQNTFITPPPPQRKSTPIQLPIRPCPGPSQLPGSLLALWIHLFWILWAQSVCKIGKCGAGGDPQFSFPPSASLSPA